MKSRLYDEKLRPKGTIYLHENQEIVTIQFRKFSEMNKKFNQVVKKFLKKNKLKIVSSEASFTAHQKGRNYSKIRKDFDIYYKLKNPKTQKMELKLLNSEKNKNA